MTTNPILEEIYSAREQLLAQAGGDLQRYLAGVRQREKASGLLIQPHEKTETANVQESNPMTTATTASH
jgi:hypothetical protein